MKKTSLKVMMEEFLSVLAASQKNMVSILPSSIQKGFFKYVDLIKSPMFKTFSPVNKAAARTKMRYLRSLLSLRTYSWNGENYDMSLLAGPLFERLAQDTELFKRLSVIKRTGGTYMEIRFGFIIMRDFINHSVRMKLEKFAKSCKVKEIAKATYPYEMYFNISDVVNDRKFPSYDHFRSTLGAQFADEYLEELRFLIEKGLRNRHFEDLLDVEDFFGWDPATLKHVFTITDGNVNLNDAETFRKNLHSSPKCYAASKRYFDANCVSMLDFLEWYNMLDCRLLSASIENYTQGFLDEWGVNVHEFISLPSLAQHLALKKFDPKAYPIYSFNGKFGFLNKEIRSQLYGGMCQVFSRLQKVKPEESCHHQSPNEAKLPKSVFNTPDGSRIKKIELLDFNSLVSHIRFYIKILLFFSILRCLCGICRQVRDYTSGKKERTLRWNQCSQLEKRHPSKVWNGSSICLLGHLLAHL